MRETIISKSTTYSIHIICILSTQYVTMRVDAISIYFGAWPEHNKSQPGSMETYSLETISQLAICEL